MHILPREGYSHDLTSYEPLVPYHKLVWTATEYRIPRHKYSTVSHGGQNGQYIIGMAVILIYSDISSVMQGMN